MLQFCRSRLKIEQNLITLFDVGICQILIKSQFLSLVIIKILVLVSDSILSPNTRSFTLMILHLKPKVMNVLAKDWFVKTNLQQKKFHFQPNFFFIRCATQSLLEIRKSYERFLMQSSKAFGARRRRTGGGAGGLVSPGGGQWVKPLKNFAIWLCQRPLDLLIFRSLRTQKTTCRKITMAIKKLLAGVKL